MGRNILLLVLRMFNIRKKSTVAVSCLIVLTVIFLYMFATSPISQGASSKIKDLSWDAEETRDEHRSDADFEVDVPNQLCETVDIVIVCGGYHASREVVGLIKSILFYRKYPLHVHFLVDPISKLILGNLFRTWDISDFTVSFYLVDAKKEKVTWIPNKHYSNIYGLIKLIVSDFLPSEIERVIVLDIDVIFLADVRELWKFFELFKREQAIGLVDNQSDWYLGTLSYATKPWPAIGRGFNTGVILLDCTKLRKINWNKIWYSVTKEVLVNMEATVLADQDIINAVLKKYPEIVHRLPCNWNVQLSQATRSQLCYGYNISSVKVLHWNSPYKNVIVKRRFSSIFKNYFQSFTEYDGGLLKRPVEQCSEKEEPIEYHEFEEGSCQDMLYQSLQLHRTHLYILPFEYKQDGEHDVTLTVHLSYERLPMLDEISNHWHGPVSVALFLSDSETRKFFRHVKASPALSERKNIGYHVVYRNFDDSSYPINLLRNVAWQQAVTNYVFLCDIDFIPSIKFYEYLKDSVLPNHDKHSKNTFVIPAFESLWYKLDFPSTKSELLEHWDRGTILPFRSYMWSQGHAMTDYTKWKTAEKEYTVERGKDYEPYVVISKALCPSYDKRFFGFGWNKVSHIMELDAAGFRFIVLPFAYVIHMPHMASEDIMRYRTSAAYRQCTDNIKQEFVNGLISKYNLDRDKFTY